MENTDKNKEKSIPRKGFPSKDGEPISTLYEEPSPVDPDPQPPLDPELFTYDPDAEAAHQAELDEADYLASTRRTFRELHSSDNEKVNAIINEFDPADSTLQPAECWETIPLPGGRQNTRF